VSQGRPSPWGGQQPWYPPPGPPKRRAALKWVLGAVVLLVVVGVTAAVTLFVTRRRFRKRSIHVRAGGTEFGSVLGDRRRQRHRSGRHHHRRPLVRAVDTVLNTLACRQDNGWLQRGPAIPANAWAPEQRAQHEAVGQAMRSAADQTVPLAKLTMHRVMRELYEQFIVYARAYVDRIATYTAPDDNLASIANSASGALGGICTAATNGSAAARGPLVALAAPTIQGLAARRSGEPIAISHQPQSGMRRLEGSGGPV
jgi:hypothetical protein